MNSEAEMREVMLHAAEKLHTAKGLKSSGYNEPMPPLVLTSMAYAEGILRLLASYLKVEPERRATATPEPGLLSPQPNNQQVSNIEKVERNAAVVTAIRAGERQQDVAARFGISPSRVRGIVAKVAIQEKD